MEKIVRYKGIEFNCVFELEEGVDAVYYGDDAHDAEGGYIYDLEIYIDTIEVSEILSDYQIECIQNLITESY